MTDTEILNWLEQNCTYLEHLDFAEKERSGYWAKGDTRWPFDLWEESDDDYGSPTLREWVEEAVKRPMREVKA